ncbi:hypothetical protein BHM03_00019846 [Ensete ventricosum]|nr:hypothetical protein BHM03_00019846 [Ensete ventricosum]
MFPLGRRVGACLRKLMKAMACKGDGAAAMSLRTNFDWLSPSSAAAMEISSQLKQVFRLIDSNGDGKISPPELCDLLLCMGHERATAAREAEVMVREADCNGDGFIDLDEFVEAVSGGGSGSGGDMSVRREELMEAFRVFDVDGNGFISPEELRRVLVRLGHGTCSLRECRLMIRGVDRNGDGLVDFDEFWSMMTAGAYHYPSISNSTSQIKYQHNKVHKTIIWDEVGESDAERDKMLLELEQECLDVYRRKVDQANRCRAQLRQAIADSEAELAAICSALGEPPVHIRQVDRLKQVMEHLSTLNALCYNVTSNIAASEQEITEANTLSLDFLNFVKVLRLEQLKVSKMKELVLKKKTELEELRRRAHLVAEAENEAELAISAIESGAIDASLILEQIEDQISAVKEEAFSRKDILERVEKWLPACEEEAWLEEYNRVGNLSKMVVAVPFLLCSVTYILFSDLLQDENRYNAGRGAHLALKRAEKARALVNKIPG